MLVITFGASPPGASRSVSFLLLSSAFSLLPCKNLTFALDKNPPGSICTGSNYGEPDKVRPPTDANINPQGSGVKYEFG